MIEENKYFIFLLVIYAMLGIPTFHIFNIPKFLIQKYYYKKIIIIMFIVTLIGLIIYLLKIISLGTFIILFVPFYQFYLYKLFHKYFIKINKREPVDVFLNFNKGLVADRVFAFFYFMLAVVPAMYIMSLMQKLK